MSKGDLDPKDWDAFRQSAHDLVDAAVDRLSHASDGPVWTPVPPKLKAEIAQDMPQGSADPEQITDMLKTILPYGVGNTHPKFFGWVHGAGAPSGLLSEIIAAAMNVNAGGRDHIGPILERQVIKWSAQMMGFGEDASGILVSGTSVATIIALKVARDQAVKQGASIADLRIYCSNQAHSCVSRAVDILGLPETALGKIACNDDFEMDMGALAQTISADRAAGRTPFAVVGTAGAVNMGAIDDLRALADLAKAQGLWFHIDGAFGAAARIGNICADQLDAIKHADSLAFDFHKWFQVNYDAGIVLIKDEAAHRGSFSDRAEYLRGSNRGLAGGAFWGVDYGPELSRGFRALKIWAHLAEHGQDKLGATIDRNIELARHLGDLVDASDQLERLAPVPMQICCFRFKAASGDLDALNQEIVYQLQESGFAVPSTTILNGQLAIRVNITNHRTQIADLEALVAEVERLGHAIA